MPDKRLSGGERNAFNCALKESMVAFRCFCGDHQRLSSLSSSFLSQRDDFGLAERQHATRLAVANLGLGGLYIRTMEPPAPGTFIQLLLDAPTGEVRASAVVQRSKPEEGMGVKFVAMQQEDRARFARWLKRLTS